MGAVGLAENKATLVQLELELGLSLEIKMRWIFRKAAMSFKMADLTWKRFVDSQQTERPPIVMQTLMTIITHVGNRQIQRFQ